MQKDDSNCSAGTTADSEQNDQDLFVSQHSSKPHVLSSGSWLVQKLLNDLSLVVFVFFEELYLYY